MKNFVYKIITISTHFTITSAQHAYVFITLVAKPFVINNEKYFQFLFQPTMQNIYFYFNNTYNITIPTCFDTFLSSSGSSKVIHR